MDKVIASRARFGRRLGLMLGSGLLGGLGCAAHPVRPPAAPLPTSEPHESRVTPDSLPAQIVAVGERESARYRIEHALLGNLGELAVTTSGLRQGTQQQTQAAAPTHLYAQGVGQGDILSFGRREQRISTTLELRTGMPSSWEIYRKLPGRELTDIATQSRPGDVQIIRKRPGQDDEPAHFHHGGPVYDPLGYLLSLRTAPLSKDAREHALLDGQAYWQISTHFAGRQFVPGSTQGNQPGTQALRFDARAVPLDWSGTPSDNRSPKSFSLWLSDDTHRLPLYLVAESPLGDVRIVLIEVKREAIEEGAVFAQATRRMLKHPRLRASASAE